MWSAMLISRRLSFLLKLSLISPLFLIFEPHKERPTRISSTAWLDGIRGLASLFVSLYHLRNGYTNSVHIGFGTGSGDSNLFQLPILRLIFAGPNMVTVFFLVSGYSLTLGSWATLHSGQTNKCLDHLCSSIFRRYIRLNLPVLASGSIVFCCTYFGLFEKTAAEDVRTGYREPQPQRFDSFTAQMMDFFKETIKYLNIWTDPTYRYPYYPHAWSIPVEFICSLFIYVFFIAVCKMRFVPQVVTFVILLTVTYLTSQVFYWIFLFGAFLAKLQVHFSDKFQSEKILSSDKHKIKFAMITMFGIGLWILSYPDWMWTSAPGYSLLSTYLPSWGEPFWLWHAIGASIILITTANSKEVQWLFSCTLSRFLGRVSYGLYLVHGIINHLLAFWMLPLIWKYTDSATTFQFEVGFWLYCIIHIPISLLAAHFFSITFDAPSIRFAKWLESRVSVDYITIGSNELVVRSELPLLPA